MDEYFLLWLSSDIKFLTIKFGDAGSKNKRSTNMAYVIRVLQLKRLFRFLSREFGIISLQIFKVQIVENGWASSTPVMKYSSCHRPSHCNVAVGVL